MLPIDNRVGDLANKVTWLNNTVVALQAKMDEPRAVPASASSLPANFQQMINSLDPAVRRAAFIGFPATTEAKERERLVNEFVKKSSPDLRLVASGCIYKGPRDNRTLTPVAYAEFVTVDDARNFANKHKDTKVEPGPHNVDVGPARTKVSGQHNYNLRVASDKLKAVSGDLAKPSASNGRKGRSPSTASLLSSKVSMTTAVYSRTVFSSPPLGEGRGTVTPQVPGKPVA